MHRLSMHRLSHIIPRGGGILEHVQHLLRRHIFPGQFPSNTGADTDNHSLLDMIWISKIRTNHFIEKNTFLTIQNTLL